MAAKAKKERTHGTKNSGTKKGQRIDAARVESGRLGQFIQSSVFGAHSGGPAVRLALRHLEGKRLGQRSASRTLVL